MNTQAHIFLDQNRIINETATCRKQISLHKENVLLPSPKLYNTLTGLQEIMLAPSATETIALNKWLTYIVLPVEGAITCATIVDQTTIAAGQVCVIGAKASSDLILKNPFNDYLVNVLIITVFNNRPTNVAYTYTYNNVNQYINSLIPVLANAQLFNKNILGIKLGFFSGRGETVNPLIKNTASTTTVFVIQGAFEVDGKLLHQGDTLLVCNAPHLEMEALSNHAILLLMETLSTKINTTHYLY